MPRIIFMGTPDFACPSLSILLSSGAEIALVVTQPDRRQGRGLKPAAAPVKRLAEQEGIGVYQPDSIRTPEVIQRILAAEAECLVLVAYGKLLPNELLTAFPLGTINVHPSLLPRYRGAAPIQRSILNGDTVTGVSIMLMDGGMDTGPLLAQTKVPISPTEDCGLLHDRLADTGARLLCETLVKWRSEKIQPVPQDDARAVAAPPIQKDELRIHWDWAAERIINTIRAFDPWPGAYCSHAQKRIKCFQARRVSWAGEAAPGEVLGISEQGLIVAAGDATALVIGALQLQGKRRLTTKDFIRGYRLEAGSRLN